VTLCSGVVGYQYFLNLHRHGKFKSFNIITLEIIKQDSEKIKISQVKRYRIKDQVLPYHLDVIIVD
jgi:hypothetical protein